MGNGLIQVLGALVVFAWIGLVHFTLRLFYPTISAVRSFSAAMIGPVIFGMIFVGLRFLFLPA